MKKKLFALVLAALMLFAVTACGTADDKLVFGTSADYPPFEFHILKDGVDTIVGFEVALAYQIADDMKKELDIVDMDFNNLLTLLAKGDCDFVIAAMELKPDRLDAATPSKPYYTDLPPAILVRKDMVDQFASFDDFSGLTVGAQLGTTMADMIDEFMPSATPLLMGSVNDLVNNLVYDKCEALILDASVARTHAAGNDQLVVLESEALALGETLPYCVWVAKGDPKGLLDDINKTIDRVLSDGTMERFISDAEALMDQAVE